MATVKRTKSFIKVMWSFDDDSIRSLEIHQDLIGEVTAELNYILYN